MYNIISLLEQIKNLLSYSDAESGYCMCGDPIESHGYGSGHSPVDSHSYYAMRLVEDINAKVEEMNRIQTGKRYVIKNSEGKYFNTDKGYAKRAWWEEDLGRARLYGRKCDASNSLNEWKAPYSSYRPKKEMEGLDTAKIVEVRMFLEETDV